MTKKEIVQQIAQKIGLTQLKTKEIVQQTFDAIVDTLLEDGRIELRNFGVFEVKQRKGRQARNPKTGERVEVQPKYVITFKPGKKMEDRVRELLSIPKIDDEDEEDEDEDDQETSEAAANSAADADPPAPPKMSRLRSSGSSQAS